MTGADRDRIRKLECATCGYTIRISRACLARGIPDCPCGAGPFTPSNPRDLIELGLLDLDSLSRRARTELCRRYGWEDEIVRTTPAQQPGSKRKGMRRRRVRALQRIPF